MLPKSAFGVELSVLKQLPRRQVRTLQRSMVKFMYLVTLLPLIFGLEEPVTTEGSSYDDRGAMDRIKEAIDGAIHSTRASVAALKEKYDHYDEAFKAKASEYFNSVQDNAKQSMEDLKDYASSTASQAREKSQEYADSVRETSQEYVGSAREKGSDYVESVRDKLTKWGESLDELESQASVYDDEFRAQVADYVTKQRQHIADVAKHAELEEKLKAYKQGKAADEL
ncbi:hypothetical protein LEN26_004981 [Aphanomyces euteiches]|nr:hypothetical protein AeMF1_006333 [Aphanomyces euteiches]KAH9145600.1 hypothetical protein LEN26_004981 [Aphanomyces euteiches]